KKILDNVTKCYELVVYDTFNETSIHKSCQSYGSNIAIATRLASGIERGKPLKGYVARATASKVIKNSTAYTYFGGFEGQGNLSRNVTLYGLNNVLSSEMELDSGGTFELYINNNYSGAFSPGIKNLTADFWTVCNATVSPGNCQKFRDGENKIEFRFTGNQSYIGGGYFKVVYNSTSLLTAENYSVYRFTDVRGLINIFSSFYVPGSIDSMDAYVHYNSNYTVFINIANATIWEGNSSGNEAFVKISSQSILGNLSNSGLSYSDLALKNIPLRMGLRNVSYVKVGQGTPSYVVISNDVSGSMAGSKISEAQNASKEFVAIVLDNPSNAVGLNNWSSSIEGNEVIQKDESHLNASINSYQANGGTCICCGINSGIFSILSNRTGWLSPSGGQLSGTYSSSGGSFSSVNAKDDVYWYLGSFSDSYDITSNITFNFSTSGLTPPSNITALRLFLNYCHDGSGSAPAACDGDAVEGAAQGTQDVWAFNFSSNNWVGIGDLRTDDSGNTVTSNFSFRPDGYSALLTATNGSLLGAYSDSGGTYANANSDDNSYWYGGSINNGYAVKFNATMNFSAAGVQASSIAGIDVSVIYCHDGSNGAPAACDGDAVEGAAQGTQDVWAFNFSSNNWVDIGDLRTDDAGDEVTSTLSIPGNTSHFIGPGSNISVRMDMEYTNGASQDSWLVVDYAYLNVTILAPSGTVNITDFIEPLTGRIMVNAELDYLNGASQDSWLVVDYASLNVSYGQPKDSHNDFMMIMSDGDANVACKEQGSGNATMDAINAACTAKKDDNITVYSVAFGSGATNATLQEIASCGGGQFYFADISQLTLIFQQIAQQILNASYSAQALIVGGQGGAGNSTLYHDSYLHFNFSPPVSLNPGEMTIDMESPKFGGNVTSPKNGNFSIPQNTRAIDARVTSYSSDYWTDRLLANNATVFDLSIYGSNYLDMGDPYIVNIPQSKIINGNNTVSIDTAFNPTNRTGGSPDSKVLYTVAISASVGYGNIFDNQSAADKDAKDRLNQSLQGFAGVINFDVQYTPTGISGIPGLWGPTTFALRVWE
ncbi:MAG: VWA domain-containing protein, partial [Candidatus Aenigmarchaeota archaeon]|nr:VWA domain-containing protein [Candidatus Aenigmarchaeota archaeon]